MQIRALLIFTHLGHFGSLFRHPGPVWVTFYVLRVTFVCIAQKTKIPVNVAFTGICFCLRFVKVELEGFEPSSKQGVNPLSTCLALT